jgi:addiction module RelB/DinJ family antitoxin
MAKTDVINARIDPDVKSRAEGILNALGMTASSAISMFYKQIILHNGLPFDVVLPPHNVGAMSAEQLDAELAAGWADVQAGRVRPASDVFADILGE